jgi:hypothetical protein
MYLYLHAHTCVWNEQGYGNRHGYGHTQDIDMDIEMNIHVPKSGRLRSYHIKKCKKKQQN